MSAYTPIPEAPAAASHWRELLEPYLRSSEIDVDRGVVPSIETVGRLALLRFDLASDIDDVQGIAEDVDAFMTALACIKREAPDAD